MIDTLFFDLYGTLVKPSQRVSPFREWITLAKGEKHEVVRTVMTHDVDELSDYEELLNVPIQLDKFEKNVQDDLASMCLYDETVSTLTALKRSGIRLCLISNLATPYKQVVFDLGLDTFFDSLVFSCACGFVKPEPQIYSIALENTHADPKNVVMVGDSFRSDFQGAQDSGIQSLHLVRQERALNNSRISTLSDISALLPQLSR